MENEITVPELFLLNSQQQEVINSVDEFFKDLITGHTSYQIKHFIIGQFYTPDRKHRQCVQELHKRFRGVVGLHYDYKKVRIELERHQLNLIKNERKLEKSKGLDTEYIKLDIKEIQNEIEIREWNLGIMRRSINATLREMTSFQEEMKKVEPNRKYNNYEDAEPEYWETQYTIERLKGKNGEQLPNIPNKPEIESLIKAQIDLGKKTIQVDKMLDERR